MSNSNLPTTPKSDKNPHQFVFEGRHKVRTEVGEDGEPLLWGTDVCDALGIENVSNAIARLDDDEKREIHIMDSIGRKQATWFITEAGLYHLIFTSRKPEAERFRKWVTSEVIPAIRKSGRYELTAYSPAELLVFHAQRLVEHEREIARHGKEIGEARKEIVNLDDRVDRLEAKSDAAMEGVNYFSVVGYCRYKNLPSPSETEARRLGRLAAKLSREFGLDIGKVRDARHGFVGTYHESVLRGVIGG